MRSFGSKEAERLWRRDRVAGELWPAALLATGRLTPW